MDADSTTGTDISPPRDENHTSPAAAADDLVVTNVTSFPFLHMPIELRNMVYRVLLVSSHGIHLECIVPKRTNQRCLHCLALCTPLLRVCRQISAEALDVLYGSNEFVCDGNQVPPRVLRDFSPENQLRLRMITLLHPCFEQGVNLDPGYQYESDWSLDFAFDSDYDTYSLVEDLDDNFGSGERLIVPEPVWHLEASDWRPIFANLTRFTITLTVDCCHWDESIISQDEGFQKYTSERMKHALRFYDEIVPDTLKKKKNCARIQQYVKKVWSMAS